MLRRLTQLVCVATITVPAIVAAAQACSDAWIVTPTPNPGSGGNGLASVAAVDAETAWAAGNSGVGTPLVLKFMGGAWQHVPAPDVSSLGTQPSVSSIAATLNGEAWVFGKVNTTYPTYNMPLALRYRNGGWDRVETITLRPQTVYPYAPRGGLLDAAVAFAPDDVWAVGNAVGFGDAAATSVPLAAHFNGSTWTDVPTPIVANRSHYLRDVHGTSGNDVWAVGYSRDVTMPYYARIFHFNGSSWSRISHPAESIHDSFLHAVFAIAPDDIWAAGSINYTTPLMMHYDGSGWSVAPLPANLPATGIRAIAATAPNRVWASFGFNDQMLFYNGSSWSLVQGPPVPDGFVERTVLAMDTAGVCDLWAVGTAFGAEFGFTYAAGRHGASVMGDVTGDGVVGVNDLLAVINAWGACSSPCPADIAPSPNGDGVVNVNDLLMVINNWG